MAKQLSAIPGALPHGSWLHSAIRPWERPQYYPQAGSRKNSGGRQSKHEKKMIKKWARRESQRTARMHHVEAYSRLAEEFEMIRLRRLAEEEPDHMDLRQWLFRWAPLGPGAWVTLHFDSCTTYEAACAGNIC